MNYSSIEYVVSTCVRLATFGHLDNALEFAKRYSEKKTDFTVYVTKHTVRTASVRMFFKGKKS
jgi:hypothetical protein